MIDASTIPASHSAKVQIELNVADRSLSVSQTGPDYLVLETPIDLEPCEGEITITVDGRKHLWKVQLPWGAQPFENTVAIRSIESAI